MENELVDVVHAVAEHEAEVAGSEKVPVATTSWASMVHGDQDGNDRCESDGGVAEIFRADARQREVADYCHGAETEHPLRCCHTV